MKHKRANVKTGASVYHDCLAKQLFTAGGLNAPGQCGWTSTTLLGIPLIRTFTGVIKPVFSSTDVLLKEGMCGLDTPSIAAHKKIVFAMN